MEGGEAYWVSKVQAERAAWEVAAEHGLDLITILPGEARGGGRQVGGGKVSRLAGVMLIALHP